MCNCKGWDIAYFPEYISVDQHFCRIADDCGHVDNTLEEAADEVVKAYEKEFEHMQSLANHPEYKYMYDTEKLMEIVSNLTMWKNRTHPHYLYYNGEE